MSNLRTLFCAAAPIALACAFGGEASAQTQCEVYTVARGDTLGLIAKRAGVTGGYGAIYNANRGRLRSPDSIRVGQQIRIPCADGSLPGGGTASGPSVVAVIETTTQVTTLTISNTPVQIITLDASSGAVAEIALASNEATIQVEPPETAMAPAEPETAPEPAEEAPVEVAAAAPEPTPAPEPAMAAPISIKFVTGTFAPWSGEDLPEQGFFTELIKESLAASGEDFDYTITFVEDWNSHLEVLLPTMAFDMTYPWALPDCTKVANLDEYNARRCTGFDATEAFYSSPSAFYTVKGGPLASTSDFAALTGKTLCRPEGHYTFDLQAEGLTPPAVILMQPQTPEECWQALVDGKADIVTYSKLVAEEEMMSAEVTDQIATLPLETLQTFHIFVSKDNPHGADFINAIDKGLNVIRSNGKWFEVVSRQLSEREARMAERGAN